MRRLEPLMLVFAILVLGQPTSVLADQLLPDSVYAWPASRPPSDCCEPPLCIDGSLQSYTWVTPPWHSGTNHLGVDLGSAATVTRIRLWKDNYDGYNPGPGHPDPDNAKNLVVQYSQGTGPMASRTWLHVPNLVNGFGGDELMHATAVHSDGTIDWDVHDSVNEGHGWASLSFDPVLATGVRVTFSAPNGFLNHYKVHEFQVWDSVISAVPEEAPGPVRGSAIAVRPNPAIGRCIIHRLRAVGSDARLRIVDAAGTLVWESRGLTTSNDVYWPGVDNSGHRVRSGCYFVCLSDGQYREASRVVLLR